MALRNRWEQSYTISEGKCSMLEILLLWFDSSHRFYTYYLLFFSPCLNIFPSQKIRNNIVEAPFGIPYSRTERQKELRVMPIVDSKIGFLLEFDRYSSD